LGLVGASRIYLKAHTTKEVIVGIISGVIGQTLAFVFYYNS
jgi:membrane-associated phospholipid phosphatase